VSLTGSGSYQGLVTFGYSYCQATSHSAWGPSSLIPGHRAEEAHQPQMSNGMCPLKETALGSAFLVHSAE
jgi:hypothetical protein